MPIAGIDLKVERIRAKVKTQPLADEMGVSRATLYAIEINGDVEPARATAYLQALAKLADVRETSGRKAVE